jgi:hypothetical protein
VLKNVLLGDERNFLGPLMRFARGNVGTKSFHAKTATDLRISAKERAAVETAKNQPSRDFRCGSIFDVFNSIGQKLTLLE